MLLVKEAKDSSTTIPSEIQTLLDGFVDICLINLPSQLLALAEIQYQIDLVFNASPSSLPLNDS